MTESKKSEKSKKIAPQLRVLDENELVVVSGGTDATTTTTTTTATAAQKGAQAMTKFASS